MNNTVGILCGPTASGKSSLAIELALKQGNLEIINADSLLVYRGMDIGTAKPTDSELALVPHHLINIRNPNQPFTAGEFVRLALNLIDEIHQRGKRVLVVGGTGFYLKALLYGLWEAPSVSQERRAALREELSVRSNTDLYEELEKQDPQAAQRIGGNDRYRLLRGIELLRSTGKTLTELQAKVRNEPDPRFQFWVLDRANPELYAKIDVRSRQMLDQGLIEEVRVLLSKFPDCRPLTSVGYAQVRNYLKGTLPEGRKIEPGLPGLIEEIKLATRQLVKTQRTWLRGQHSKIPSSRWFQLEDDRTLLEEAFKTVYG